MTKQELIKAMLNGWTEESFCQRTLARDKEGNGINPLDLNAVKFCAFGRMYSSVPGFSFERHDDIIMHPIAQIRLDFVTKHGIGLASYNDTHTFAEVKEALENLYEE